MPDKSTSVTSKPVSDGNSTAGERDLALITHVRDYYRRNFREASDAHSVNILRSFNHRAFDETTAERNIDFWTHDMLCGLINYAWTIKKQHPDLQPHQANDILHDFITTVQHEEEVEQEP